MKRLVPIKLIRMIYLILLELDYASCADLPQIKKSKLDRIEKYRL